MIKSWSALWRDPQFISKIAVLIIGAIVHLFILETADRSYYAVITIAYHYSFLSLVITILIASVWFGTTARMEVSLLTVAAIKLLVCTFAYNLSNSVGYEIYVTKSEDTLKFHFFNLSREQRFYILMVLNITSVIITILNIYMRMTK